MGVKLGYEKETYKKQEGWVASYTLSDYAGMRLGMSHLESIGEGSNKCFHEYISSKIKTWENVGLVLGG